MRIVLTLLLLAGCAAAAEAGDLQAQTKSWPVSPGTRLRFDFPVGELRVEPGDDTHVRLELMVHCTSWDHDRCEREAEKLGLDVDQSSSELSVRVTGYSKMHSNGFTLRGTLQVPRSLDARLRMDVGDLDLDGHAGNLDVDLGVGQATLALTASSFRSASVDAGVGDVSLKALGHRQSSSGFVGRTVHWDDGRGASRVKVHVGVGDARVRLD